MTSKGLQSFAIGLFLATAILGGLYFLEEKDSPEPEQHPVNIDQQKLSIDEMKEELEEDGYTILAPEEIKEMTHPNEDEKVIYKTVLTIEKGMSSLDIADALLRTHIITDEDAFLTYIEENDLTTSLKTGQYELTNELTLEEITTQLTN